MDEPTAALGVKETAQVLDLIRRLKADGKTIILVSHNMADVVAVATRVAIFKNGRKVIDRADCRPRCRQAGAHGDDGERRLARDLHGAARSLPASSSASISRCTFRASRPLIIGSRF